VALAEILLISAIEAVVLPEPNVTDTVPVAGVVVVVEVASITKLIAVTFLAHVPLFTS
jgi:hypothetical protein